MSEALTLSVEQIAAATGGALSGDTSGLSVRMDLITTDSRHCAPGSLYAAKRGEHADGHHFVRQAHEAGAVLTLAERKVTDSSGKPLPAVLVADTQSALGALARYVLHQLRSATPLTVIAITGSMGKTTTKDLIAHLCSQHGPTVAAERSFNGEIGVPLTIFRMKTDTRYLVLEMGARARGEIRYLTHIAPPDIAVVLSMGAAHVGEFGGLENTALAKRELIEDLDAGARAILNADDPRVRSMAAETNANILFFGRKASAPSGQPVVTAETVTTDEQARPQLEMVFPDGVSASIHAQLIGEHHCHNLLAAAAAGWALGFEARTVARALSEAKPASRWRMERIDRDDHVTILNDAYNANPEAMKAALHTLVHLGRPPVGPQRRIWAVLGAMYELGTETVSHYHALAQAIVRLNIDRLLVVGQDAKPLYNGAVAEGSWGQEVHFAPTVEQAYSFLSTQLETGDIVLIKSSLAAGLIQLGERLAAPDEKSLTARKAAGARSERGPREKS